MPERFGRPIRAWTRAASRIKEGPNCGADDDVCDNIGDCLVPIGSGSIDLARRNQITVAWANEAFGLWYLLHFNFHDAGISRHDYKIRLKKFGIKYDKADQTMYARLASEGRC
ncbi:MAG: RloB domain-containing protein, partial [Limisphaerales bacterium]